MNEEKTTLRHYFQNFLAQEKAKVDSNEEYINFLKILWLGFDDFVQKTKIQRKIYILEQIENFLTDVIFQKQIKEIALPDQSEIAVSQNSETPVIKIKEINIVNFRGFQANDDGKGRKIDFNKKATLFFAPNGGGKTSLCEALEWALTGDTSERTERQIEPIGSYFQNNDKSEPNFNTTKLTLVDDTVLIPNPVFDRCFLEKNRIEKFAKLAIQPNSKLQEVLGELFGFSDVIDFFKEFGQDLSPTDNEKNRAKRENWRIWLDWNNKKTPINERKNQDIAQIIRHLWARLPKSSWNSACWNAKERKIIFGSIEQEKAFGLKAIAMTKNYVSKADLSIIPLSLEDWMQCSVGEFMIAGRIDRIDQDSESSISVWDYKTGKLPFYDSIEKMIKEDIQVPVYAIIASKLNPFAEKIRVGLIYIKYSKVYDITWTKEELKEVESRIIDIIKEVKDNTDFLPRINTLCPWCEYKNICPDKDKIKKKDSKVEEVSW